MPAQIAFPKYPKTEAMHGIALHSPEITLAVVSALKQTILLAQTHDSPQALRKLSVMGITPKVIELLDGHSAVALTEKIESYREAASIEAEILRQDEKRLALAKGKGLVFKPSVLPQRVPMDQALVDFGEFRVCFSPALLHAMVQTQPKYNIAKPTAKQALILRLVKAGARGSTIKDIFGTSSATFRTLCEKHQLPRVAGRPEAPSGQVKHKILLSYEQLLATQPEILHKPYAYAHFYLTLRSEYLHSVPVAVVHGVLKNDGLIPFNSPASDSD